MLSGPIIAQETPSQEAELEYIQGGEEDLKSVWLLPGARQYYTWRKYVGMPKSTDPTGIDYRGKKDVAFL